MNILEEVRENFAALDEKKAIPISDLSQGFKAWTIKMDNFYGVAIPYPEDREKLVEKFNNVKLWNYSIIIGGKEESLLLLTSSEESLRYQFASICSEFIDPGEAGERREELLGDPLLWWSKWKALLGNSVKNISPSSIVAELLVLEKLTSLGRSPVWGGRTKSTHDIEVEGENYEVKSTISRYETSVTISSQYQLDRRDSDLYLIFCRLEASKDGDSINDLVKRLVSLGTDKYSLENHLDGLGLEEGSSARNKKYKLHEMRKYKVDESFPKITLDSFKDNKLPEAVIGIQYSIDLGGIEYEGWKEQR